MSYGIVLILFPPASLIWVALLLGASFAAVFGGVKLLKINQNEPAEFNGSRAALTFSVWGISVAAFFISYIILLVLSFNIPELSIVHSEWGIAQENAYAEAIIFFLIWIVLFICLQLPNKILLKKRLPDESKRTHMLILLLFISTVVWLVPLCIIFL